MPVAGHLMQPTQKLLRTTGSPINWTVVSLFGLASDGVYPASSVTRTAVRSYRNLFTLTYQIEEAVYFLWHFP